MAQRFGAQIIPYSLLPNRNTGLFFTRFNDKLYLILCCLIGTSLSLPSLWVGKLYLILCCLIGTQNLAPVARTPKLYLILCCLIGTFTETGELAGYKLYLILNVPVGARSHSGDNVCGKVFPKKPVGRCQPYYGFNGAG